MATYPLLNDKKYLSWDGDPGPIVGALLARLSKSAPASGAFEFPATGRKIPMPAIKKGFTQREKDLFLKTSFSVVRDYFKEALSQLEQGHKGVETEFTEIHPAKYLAKIYINGDIKGQCKIWVGGISSSNSIAFYSGSIGIDNDGTMSDWLTVEHSDEKLGLKPSGMALGYHPSSEKTLLSPEEGAEYFWKRFTEYLS